MTIKNEEKVRYWENIILRGKQTSLSMTQFCKLENLSIDTFKYWKYKLAGSRNSEAASHDLLKTSEPAKLVPVKVAEEVAELPEFSHVKPNKSSDIYIRIGSKSSLIIPDNFKAETLARILGVLQNL